MNERSRLRLADVRKQPKKILKEQEEIVPDLIVDEKYLMLQVRLGDARELMKGRVVNVCSSVIDIGEERVLKSKCPLLSPSQGCSKSLVMVNETVSCPVGKGVLRIQSDLIPVLEIPGMENSTILQSS